MVDAVTPLSRPRPRRQPRLRFKPRRFGLPRGWGPVALTVTGFLGASLFIVLLDAYPPTQREFEGVAHVIDGDGLRLDGAHVRLLGVDAMEFDQTCKVIGQSWECGREATQSLQRLAQGRMTRCETAGLDRYGRRLGTCYSADGRNLNREQVRLGWAIASGPRYLLDELAARSEERGVWASEFDRPQIHRALAD